MNPQYKELVKNDEQFGGMLMRVFGCVKRAYEEEQSDEVLVLVWCKRGKHRSTVLAELLFDKVNETLPNTKAFVWHLEQARWDPVVRREWRMDREHSVPVDMGIRNCIKDVGKHERI